MQCGEQEREGAHSVKRYYCNHTFETGVSIGYERNHPWQDIIIPYKFIVR